MRQVGNIMASIIGYYTLTHLPSGHFYIGSSINLRGRIYNHMHALNKGSHANHRWQQVYTDWKDIHIEEFHTDTEEDARRCEQLLINEHFHDPFCCNLNPSVDNRLAHLSPEAQRLKGVALGNSRKGVKHTPEHIANARAGRVKPRAVVLDGVWYESVRKASEVTGIPMAKIRARITFGRKKYADWKFE